MACSEHQLCSTTPRHTSSSRALLSHQFKRRLRSTNPRPPTLLPPSASICVQLFAQLFAQLFTQLFTQPSGDSREERWRLPCACNMYTCVLHVRVPPPAPALCRVTCACCVFACCPHACRALLLPAACCRCPQQAAGSLQQAAGSKRQAAGRCTRHSGRCSTGWLRPAWARLRQARPSDQSGLGLTLRPVWAPRQERPSDRSYR